MAEVATTIQYQRLVRAQRRDVEPMRDRRDPGQGACLRRRYQAHFTKVWRHVDRGAGAVAHGEFVERQIAAELQRPLIGPFDGAFELDVADVDSDELRGDAARRVDVDLFERLAGVGEHGGGAVWAREPIRGTTHDRRQRDAAEAAGRSFGRFGRRVAHGVEVERRQVCEPRLRAQRRHSADVDHGDPGDEPQHKQDAQRNAEIAVGQDSARRKVCMAGSSEVPAV
jgi:hypothetical protein